MCVRAYIINQWLPLGMPCRFNFCGIWKQVCNSEIATTLKLVTKEGKWQSAVRVACAVCFWMHYVTSLEMVFQVWLITVLCLSKDYREMFWEERDGDFGGAGGSGEIEGVI